MLNPDLHPQQPILVDAVALPAVDPRDSDTVRYLSDLWENLLAIQDLLACERQETAG